MSEIDIYKNIAEQMKSDKDEIKELKSKLECYENGVYYSEEVDNLEQENERLKELCNRYEEEHNNEFKIWKEERSQLRDYKSRNEKAIEYINHAQNYGTMAQVMPHLKPYVNGDDLLNILQGESDE